MSRLCGTCGTGLVLLAASLATPALADVHFAPCRPGAKVYYVNGVNKTDEQAVADAATWLAANIHYFDVRCVAQVDHLYNPSDGLMADVLGELATQKATELRIAFADALLQVGFAAFGRVSSLDESHQQEVRNRVAAFVQEASLASYAFEHNGQHYTTADLVNEFRDRVLVELGQGTKTILLAHSQGNMFANETYVAVRGRAPEALSQGLAVVNVANPSSTAPSDFVITTHQDRIISPLIPWGATPSNFDATGSYVFDLTGHGFSEIYLSSLLPQDTVEERSVAARVMKLLQQAIDSSPDPVAAIYGSTSYSLFGLDLTTSVATVLAPFTYAASNTVPVWDIAVSPRDGAMYAISPYTLSAFVPSDRSLDPLRGADVGGNALAFSASGELYGMSGRNLYRIDIVSGAATLLPVSLGEYISSGDLTFDSDGNLFGTAIGSDGNDSLLQIDLNRSTVAVVGPTGYSSVYGLYFSGGVLYGVTNGGTLITIDRTTGAGETIGHISLGDVTGLQ